MKVGGAVAAVGVVGALGAAAAFGGAKASHHGRRRSRDKVQACENTNPLDTTDDDCYVARWNLMVDYFPAHQGLQKADRDLVQTMAESQAAWSEAMMGIESANAALYGMDNGMVNQSVLLSNATAQMHRSYIGGVGSIYATLLNNTADAASDVRDLKKYLASALSSLLNSVTEMLAKQDKIASRNAELMNSRATGSLKSAVGTVVNRQGAVTAATAAGGPAFSNMQTAFVSDGKATAASLSDAADGLDTFSGRMVDNAATVAEQVSGGMGESSDTVITRGNELTKHVNVQMDNVQVRTVNASIEALEDAQISWERNSAHVGADARTELSEAQDVIRDRLVQNVAAAAATFSSSLSDAVDNGTSNIRANVANMSAAVESFGAHIIGQSNSIATEADMLRGTANQVRDDTQFSVMNGESGLSSFLHSLNSEDTAKLNDLMARLRATQTSAASDLSTAYGKQSDLVSQLLAALGTLGVSAENAIALVQRMTEKSNAKLDSGMDVSESVLRGSIRNTFSGVGGELDQATDIWVSGAVGVSKAFIASNVSMNSDVVDSSTAMRQELGNTRADFYKSYRGIVKGIEDSKRSELITANETKEDGVQLAKIQHELELETRFVANVSGWMEQAGAAREGMHADSIALSDDVLSDAYTGRVQTAKAKLAQVGPANYSANVAAAWRRENKALDNRIGKQDSLLMLASVSRDSMNQLSSKAEKQVGSIDYRLKAMETSMDAGLAQSQADLAAAMSGLNASVAPAMGPFDGPATIHDFAAAMFDAKRSIIKKSVTAVDLDEATAFTNRILRAGYLTNALQGSSAWIAELARKLSNAVGSLAPVPVPQLELPELGQLAELKEGISQVVSAIPRQLQKVAFENKGVDDKQIEAEILALSAGPNAADHIHELAVLTNLWHSSHTIAQADARLAQLAVKSRTDGAMELTNITDVMASLISAVREVDRRVSHAVRPTMQLIHRAEERGVAFANATGSQLLMEAELDRLDWPHPTLPRATADRVLERVANTARGRTALLYTQESELRRLIKKITSVLLSKSDGQTILPDFNVQHSLPDPSLSKLGTRMNHWLALGHELKLPQLEIPDLTFLEKEDRFEADMADLVVSIPDLPHFADPVANLLKLQNAMGSATLVAVDRLLSNIC